MTRRIHVSFTITLVTAFALVFVAALLAVIAGYRQTGSAAARETAERSLAQAAALAAAETQALIRPVLAFAGALPEFVPLGGGADPDRGDTRALLTLLGREPAIQLISLGFADGTLRQVAQASALAASEAPRVPPDAAFALREVLPDAPTERWVFLDGGFRRLAEGRVPARPFAPWQAPWFLSARDDSVHVSPLYDLALVGRPGLSVSRRVPGTAAVLSFDVGLDLLAAFLGRLRASPGSVLFLFSEEGLLLAHQRPEVAAVPIGGGRTSWTTLIAAADPLVQRVWEEFAQGRLVPGRTAELDAADGPLLVRLSEVEGLAAPRLLVAVLAPAADFTGPVDQALHDGTALALSALAGGLAGIGVLAWRVSRPLIALSREAEAIRRLDLDGPVPVRSRITEVARLAEAMDGMKSGLRLFGAYVPKSLVARLMQEGEAARLGGVKRPISVMFSDVREFTALAETVPPEELMRITSRYFEELTSTLLDAHATIDKYIGDAVMALWNAPQEDASHAWNACRAALRARLVTDRLCDRFAERGWPPLVTRFAVHSGDAVVGNVGSSDRMSYTAIGSMVNLASRLEGMNKFYGTRILISEATRALAGAALVSRPVDLVMAKGSAQPVELHELLGFAVVDSVAEAPLRPDPRLAEGLPAWRRMIGAYRAGRFDEAASALAEAADPGTDPLARLYADRLAELRSGAPPGWSPVMRATAK